MTQLNSQYDQPAMTAVAETGASETSFQLGTVDLFVFTAFAAALSWLFANSWATVSGFTGVLVGAALIGSLFLWRCFGNRKPVGVLWILGLVAVGSMMIGALSIAAIAAAHFVAALIVIALPKSYCSFRVCSRLSLIAILVGIGVWSINTPWRIASLIQAREAYPIEDLSHRLNYESSSEDTTGDHEPIKLAADVDRRLGVVPTRRQGWFGNRIEALEKIHSDNYDRFVRSMGFGIARMPSLGIYHIATPDIPEIMPDDRWQPPGDDYDSDFNSWGRHLERSDELTALDLEEFHFQGNSDFVHPNTLGYVRSEQQAAGFLPHAFHFPVSNLVRNQVESLELEQLQLISLLRFEQPKAYVLDHLPRMDHLSGDDVPTRDLTPFELTALEQLQTQKDIVVSESQGKLQMVGSLRAAENCLDCHSVKRGELLGVFTYQFAKREIPK